MSLSRLVLLSELYLRHQITDGPIPQVDVEHVGPLRKSPTELLGNFPEYFKNIKHDCFRSPIRTVPLIKRVASNQAINLKKTEANLKKKATWKTIPPLPARRGASSTSTPPR